ncbi:hypothetical protein Q7P37_008296 [Cladosporium fusiforme]
MALNKHNQTTLSGGADRDEAPINSFDKSDAVTLIVGTEIHEMLVHGNIISRESAFFKSALRKEWREGQTRVIHLPADRPAVMQGYINFLYTKRLPTSHLEYCISEHGDDEYTSLAELYILADRLLDNALICAVLREILRLTDCLDERGCWWVPSINVIDLLYSRTTAAASIRRMLVDLYVSAGNKDWLTSSTNPAFLLDVAQLLLQRAHNDVDPRVFRDVHLDIEDYLP